MPRTELYTDASHEEALDAVAEACKPAGFHIVSEGKRKLTVQKGSLATSIFLGAFVVYCNCQVTVERDGDELCIDFEWGTTWWQGIFGPMRTKTAMNQLIDHVCDILEDEGREIMERLDR
ncbi:MAG: hypothetical protein U0798_15600 [Gemmataceae bacterium]